MDTGKGMHLLSDACIGIQAEHESCNMVLPVIFAGDMPIVKMEPEDPMP